MTSRPSSLPSGDPSANVALAALWMVGAIVLFSAMAIAGREISVELDTFELMTYRSMVGLVIVLIVARIAGTMDQIRIDRFGVHLGRNIAHFIGQNLWFLAIAVIPFAHAFALEFTSPLWVMLLAPVFLGERFSKVKLLAGILGFAGILIVVRPGALPLTWGTMAAATAAVFFAATAIFTKRLTRDQEITQIMFWLASIQLVLGLACCLVDGTMALPSAAMVPWVILIGICGLSAHFCLTTALSLAPASIVVPIDFVRLPAIALIGMLFYDEPLEIAVFAGAALILAANYINIRSARS